MYTSLITLLFISPVAFHYEAPLVIPKVSPKEIVVELMKCESSNGLNRYNPEDNDGLPKYGILQFRYDTFKEQAILYKMLPKNADFQTLIWNDDLQIPLATKMVEDGKGWRWGCYETAKKALGLL